MPDNFGIDNTTKSSALGLQQLLGQSSMLNQTLQAQMLGQQAQALQAQESPSLLQRLLSPGGLALLAGSGIAANQGGPQAGLAFAGGGLQGIQQQIANDEAQKVAAVEALQKQRDDALDRAEKSMNRVSQIFNTNPDAFTDPETGEPTIDETLLGILATGEPIMLSPNARRKLNRSDAQQTARHNFMVDALKESQTIEDARNILHGIFGNQGWKNPPTQVLDSLAKSIGTPEFESEMIRTIMDYGGTSGKQALVTAATNGVSPADPSIIKMIDWSEKQPDDLTPTQVEDLKILSLDEELTKWRMDPANAKKVEALKRKHGTDQSAMQSEIVDIVLGERSGDWNIYVNARRHLIESGELGTLWKGYADSGALFDLTNALTGLDPKFRSMSADEQVRFRATAAYGVFQALRDQVNETKAVNDGLSLNNATNRFIREIPGMNSDQASVVAQEILKDATDENGNVDQAKFNSLVDLVVQQFSAKRTP